MRVGLGEYGFSSSDTGSLTLPFSRCKSTTSNGNGQGQKLAGEELDEV